MRLIIEDSFDPRHNLAREETLLEQAREDTIYLWRNGPSVIVGRHQNTWTEVNTQVCQQKGIPIVRRLTGGGAVYHDLGNINLSYIFVEGDTVAQQKKGLSLILDFLQSRGAACFLSGRNDICMTDTAGAIVKVSGTAMTQREARGIIHGCVLYDSDLCRLSSVLTPRSEKLHSKGIPSVRSRVGNLRNLVPALKRLDCDGFFADWCDTLASVCMPAPVSNAKELARVEQLMLEKYGTNAWNIGRNPGCTMENRRRFPVGMVEFHAAIKGGKIKDCCFTGDYLAAEDFEEIAALLQGCVFTRGAIETAVAELDLCSFFGTKSRAEILDFLEGRSQ